MADLMFRAVDELASMVRTGELSARELVQESLDRIDELNPQLNAFVDVFADEALAEADSVGADDPRPFAGVPIAIKNNRAVAGKRLTVAAEFMGDFVPKHDDNVVARLKAAGFIVVGTTTPDTIFPSTACVLQDKIGAHHAWGFDLGAACSGFTYSLNTAAQMVATGNCDYALAVGADVMSSIIDYTDRATCVLFGDGAGAVVAAPAAEGEPHILDFAGKIDGSGGPALCMPAGGSRMPASHETVDQRMHFVKQEGATVFKFAVKNTEEIARRVLERNGLGTADLDLFVSHQANRRIIEAAAERLGLGPDKFVVNLEMYGNTTAGTIPLALADARRQGRLKKGDLVLLASVGAGFTVGALLLRWSL